MKDTAHPSWCQQRDCDTNGHMSERLTAGGPNAEVLIDVALVGLDVDDIAVTVLELGVTSEGERTAWLLGLVQGDDLAAVLDLLRRKEAGR